MANSTLSVLGIGSGSRETSDSILFTDRPPNFGPRLVCVPKTHVFDYVNEEMPRLGLSAASLFAMTVSRRVVLRKAAVNFH